MKQGVQKERCSPRRRDYIVDRAADDPKGYIMALADRGELLLSRPLRDQLQAALERLGFQSVRVDHERVHDVWLIRATVGTNVDCTSARIARNYLHRMARSLGKRLVRGVVHPVLERGRVRAALLFDDVRPVGLEPVEHDPDEAERLRDQ